MRDTNALLFIPIGVHQNCTLPAINETTIPNYYYQRFFFVFFYSFHLNDNSWSFANADAYKLRSEKKKQRKETSRRALPAAWAVSSDKWKTWCFHFITCYFHNFTSRSCVLTKSWKWWQSRVGQHFCCCFHFSHWIFTYFSVFLFYFIVCCAQQTEYFCFQMMMIVGGVVENVNYYVEW